MNQLGLGYSSAGTLINLQIADEYKITHSLSQIPERHVCPGESLISQHPTDFHHHSTKQTCVLPEKALIRQTPL